jgi:hypothetical protein
MRLIRRYFLAFIFIVVHSLTALLCVSLIYPSWILGCGIVGAAFGTVLLILFAGEESSAKLFFFENWDELEQTGSAAIGLIFMVIALVWLVPILCFLVTLGAVWFNWFKGF